MQDLEAWPASKLKAWKELWESEMGVATREHFNRVLTRLLEGATEADSDAKALQAVHEATGIRLCLGIIDLGIVTANEAIKQEKEGADQK